MGVQAQASEFVIFSYLCYHRAPSMLTPEMITAGIHMTTGTVKRYLDRLAAKELVNEDGTPVLNCKDEKFFTLPNEVFLLQLPPSVFMVYAYLLLIEDRRWMHSINGNSVNWNWNSYAAGCVPVERRKARDGGGAG